MFFFDGVSSTGNFGNIVVTFTVTKTGSVNFSRTPFRLISA